MSIFQQYQTQSVSIVYSSLFGTFQLSMGHSDSIQTVLY